MWQSLKDFYIKNKWWVQWMGVIFGPLAWAAFFYWIVFLNGWPQLNQFLRDWMISKFTMTKFIRSSSILVILMFIWKYKPIPKFSPFITKFFAGSLLSGIIGADIANAIWNYKNRQYPDTVLFIVVFVLTWGCYIGIRSILNKQP
jgi:hypothetical protein